MSDQIQDQAAKSFIFIETDGPGSIAVTKWVLNNISPVAILGLAAMLELEAKMTIQRQYMTKEVQVPTPETTQKILRAK